MSVTFGRCRRGGKGGGGKGGGGKGGGGGGSGIGFGPAVPGGTPPSPHSAAVEV